MGILAFVTGPVGRYVVGGVLVIGLLAGIRSHFIHQGQLEGKDSAQTDIAATLEKQRAQDRTDLNAKIANADKQVEQAQRDRDASAVREQNAVAAVNKLVNQHNQEVAKIKGLSDSQLHDYITQTLKLRDPADRTPGYTPPEEREIANRVSDAPALKEQLSQQDGRITEIQNQMSAMQRQIDATNTKFTALATYTTEVERDYTMLYNERQKGSKLLRIVTFGLAGKPNKIAEPEPATLIGKHPGKESK